jgi:hypothetical protein
MPFPISIIADQSSFSTSRIAGGRLGPRAFQSYIEKLVQEGVVSEKHTLNRCILPRSFDGRTTGMNRHMGEAASAS